MMELQGAVGIAQLEKLNKIIELQRANKKLLWDSVCDLDFVKPRKIPDGSYETADALIFFVPSRNFALICREKLIKKGLGTKILPEAYTWHFAGSWSHLNQHTSEELSLSRFNTSHNILSKAISIPITMTLKENASEILRNSLLETHQEIH